MRMRLAPPRPPAMASRPRNPGHPAAAGRARPHAAAGAAHLAAASPPPPPAAASRPARPRRARRTPPACGKPPATNPPCSPAMPPGWPSPPNPPMPPNIPSPPRPPPGPSPPIIMNSIGLTWPAAPDVATESPEVPTENPGGRLSCAATASSDSSTPLTPACWPCPPRPPACACCPPAGVPTVPRNGAGAPVPVADRPAARSPLQPGPLPAQAARLCGRRCCCLRSRWSDDPRGERQREVLLRPARRVDDDVFLLRRERHQVRDHRIGAGPGNRRGVDAVDTRRRPTSLDRRPPP